MKIKIETNFIPLILAYDDLPEGVTLDRLPFIEKRSADFSDLATGILSFSLNISSGIVAAWIYDKIKNLPNKDKLILKINEKQIRRISQDEITEEIEREIKIKKH